MTDDDFDALWTNLVERSHQPRRAPLTADERVFYAVNLLRGSVPRSGFIGYFENWTGAEISAAHRGLRVLELETALGLLTAAQTLVLGDQPLPDEAVSLTVFPDSLSEEEHEEASSRLDEALTPIEEQFYPLDDEIYEALCSFADTHRLKPIDP
jgi:hypothetical protein